MANKKFSEFVLKTSTSDVSHIVGYNGAENVQITPANFVTGGGTGVFLPLAGGLMVGNTTHNDNVKSIYGSPGNDLQIYHDGSNSYIDDTGTGSLFNRASLFIVQDVTGTKNSIIGNALADVKLYNNGVLKFATTSLGATVTGDLLVTGTITGTGGSYLPLAGGTLTGDLTLSSGKLEITGSSGINTVGKFEGGSGSTTTYLQILPNGADDSNSGYIGYDTSNFLRFYTQNTLAFYLDASQNATFAGDVTLSAAGSTGEIIRTTDNTEPYFAFQRNSGVNGVAVLNLEDGGHLAFDTGATGAVQSEKMRLDANGNLGVGTSTPASKLDVSAASGDGLLVSNSTALAYNAGLIVNYNDVSTMQLTCLGTSILQAGNTGNTVLASRTNKDIIITPNGTGNVGVGTVTPTEKLEVVSTSTNVAEFSGAANATVKFKGLGFVEAKIQCGGEAVFGSTNNFPTSFITNNTEKMRISSGGDVFMGTTSNISGVGTARLTVKTSASGSFAAAFEGEYGVGINANAGNGNLMYFYYSGQATPKGSISTDGTSVAFNTTSDYRLKEDLQDFKGLDLVSKIPVYDFKWKTDESRSYGVMAHELQEVLPDAVSGDKDAEEMQGVDYSKIVPLLVKSIQELSAKLEALECQCKKK
jgi:hypothetical protein